MEIESKYKNILDQYVDKSFVYSVLCSKASSYYNMLKYGFQLPLILTSTVMTYINANNDESMAENMKIVNPVFNLITAVLLSINNMFKFESKANDFKNNSIKFQKLSHLIEQKILKNDISDDFIQSIISQYDTIVENCLDVPHHICNNTRILYGGKKHLPIVCNGVEKLEKEQSMSSKMEYLNKLSV